MQNVGGRQNQRAPVAKSRPHGFGPKADKSRNSGAMRSEKKWKERENCSDEGSYFSSEWDFRRIGNLYRPVRFVPAEQWTSFPDDLLARAIDLWFLIVIGDFLACNSSSYWASTSPALPLEKINEKNRASHFPTLPHFLRTLGSFDYDYTSEKNSFNRKKNNL